MTLELLGAIVAGIALLGVVLFVNRVLLRNYFGRWLYTAAAAAGMLGFSLWSEYSWPSRALAAQPALVAAAHNEHSVFYRPWTFIWPQQTQLITVNTAMMDRHAQNPDLVMTQIVLVARWRPLQSVLAIFDCAANASVAVEEGVRLTPEGALEGGTWTELEASDPVLRTVCAAAEGGDNDRSNGT